jgi:hypothetical protein
MHGPQNVKFTNAPVVLYGYKTWSLALREEYKGRVFENMSPKWGEVTGD